MWVSVIFERILGDLMRQTKYNKAYCDRVIYLLWSRKITKFHIASGGEPRPTASHSVELKRLCEFPTI